MSMAWKNPFGNLAKQDDFIVLSMRQMNSNKKFTMLLRNFRLNFVKLAGTAACSGAAIYQYSNSNNSHNLLSENAYQNARSPEMQRNFSLGKSRFDQETYQGRLKSMFQLINPMNLFINEKEIEDSKQLLQDYREGNLRDDVTDDELWSAQEKISSVIHPVTQEPMFILGRMSAFIPVNIPIALGMIIHGSTGTAAQIFWQVVNQSYNVVNNYTNRGGMQVDWSLILKSYALAVASATTIAISAGVLMKRIPSLQSFNRIIPYIAVVTAGALNVGFTRIDEITNGIPVYDDKGNTLGISQLAGKLAVFKTIATRSMFLPVFPLLLPPVAVASLKSLKLLPKSKPLLLAVEILIISLCIGIGLPAALAIEPQKMEIRAEKLEPEFQNLVDQDGKLIEILFANKGL